VAMERARANKTITKSNTRDTRFYPVIRPSNICLLPRCGVPMDEGCTQPLSSDPMIGLNTTVFYLEYSSRLRGISTSWSLSPLQSYDHKESTRVRMREQHTQDSNPQHNHAHKPRLELKTQHREFTTQTKIKSLTQRIKCVETKSGGLRMFLENLVYCSMRLGVPFIAPRQLRAVEDQFGRHSCLLSSGAPDSPVHHRTGPVAVWCTISFHIGHYRPLVLRARWHTGQSDVPSRPLARTTWHSLIARTTVGRRRRWLTEQSDEL
jgi:hypothetical protein